MATSQIILFVLLGFFGVYMFIVVYKRHWVKPPGKPLPPYHNGDFFEHNNKVIRMQTLLGQGYYGTVYSGTMTDLHTKQTTDVAIKVMGARQTSEATVREKQFLQRLRPPEGCLSNVLCLVLMFTSQGSTVLVTEKIKGPSLDTFLSKVGGYFKPQHAKRLMFNIAHGLRELHSRNIVHGDFELKNIMLVKDMPSSARTVYDFDIKIVDLGMACEFKEEDDDNTGAACAKATDLYKLRDMCAQIIAKTNSSKSKDDIYEIFKGTPLTIDNVIEKLSSFSI